MKQFLLLLRPHQWVKNVFVFLPVFFSGQLTNQLTVFAALYAFFAYCFAASGIYCFNDIYDVNADRLHPVKKSRPIASGAISKSAGYVIMLICFVASLSIVGYFYRDDMKTMMIVGGVILFYIIINIAYCVILKHKPIIDVFIIAVGFVLRVLVGGFATGIWMSPWIILMTFLLALFLAFAKRRDDVVMYEETGVKARENIYRYNVAFMNQAIGIVASITMVCYIMYTVSSEIMARFHSQYLYVTSVFVLAGIIRYLQITIVDVKSGSPTKVLLRDRFIQLCIVGWIISFFLIIYF